MSTDAIEVAVAGIQNPETAAMRVAVGASEQMVALAALLAVRVEELLVAGALPTLGRRGAGGTSVHDARKLELAGEGR
jgi:hypothetical protein